MDCAIEVLQQQKMERLCFYVFLLSSLMFISINAETLDECKNEKTRR